MHKVREQSFHQTCAQSLTFLVPFLSGGTSLWTPPDAHNTLGLVSTQRACTSHTCDTVGRSGIESRRLWSCCRPTAHGSEMVYWFPNKITVYGLLASTIAMLENPGPRSTPTPSPPPEHPSKPSVLNPVLKALVSISNHKHKAAVELWKRFQINRFRKN